MISSAIWLRLTFVWLQVLAAAIVAISIVWMTVYQGGFAWQENPKIQFNYHPVFLTVGLVVVAGEIKTVQMISFNDFWVDMDC